MDWTLIYVISVISVRISISRQNFPNKYAVNMPLFDIFIHIIYGFSLVMWVRKHMW